MSARELPSPPRRRRGREGRACPPSHLPVSEGGHGIPCPGTGPLSRISLSRKGKAWQLPLPGKPRIPGDEELSGNRTSRTVDSESSGGWGQGSWLPEAKARACGLPGGWARNAEPGSEWMDWF